MEKLENREYDFSSKLRQESIVARLKEYILWQRGLREGSDNQRLPTFSPVSINLDLTSACNFSCSHCVDSMIINTGEYLKLEDTKETIDVLHANGLLSLILLGGGEPTLNKDFEEIVKYIKKKKLEVGIVTNGSGLEKIASVVNLLEKRDWIRISLDAAREETFQNLHQPKTKVTLEGIFKQVKNIREISPLVSLGYSFVIVWEGMEINGNSLNPNIDEMAEAVRLGAEHSFDYISFKPCLIRLVDSQKESLLNKVNKDQEDKIIEKIKASLLEAKTSAGDKINILESVNLKAMLNRETDRIKKQPKICHMQFFRTVVTPSGIFHCPAFRGIRAARIAEYNGYTGEAKFFKAQENLAKLIFNFNAEEECKVVGCFYHHVNWWIENFINSKKDIEEIAKVEDDNFFL